MNQIVHVILFLFVGAMLVAVLTHASGFATAVSSVGGQITNDAKLLTGANVNPISS